MNNFINSNGGSSSAVKHIINNPERAAQEMKKLSDRLQAIIDANPSKKINELF